MQSKERDHLYHRIGIGVVNGAQFSKLCIIHGSTEENRTRFIFRGLLRAISKPGREAHRFILVRAGFTNPYEELTAKLYQFGFRVLEKSAKQGVQEERHLGYLRNISAADFLEEAHGNRGLVTGLYTHLNYVMTGSHFTIVDLQDSFLQTIDHDDYRGLINLARFFATNNGRHTLVISLSSSCAPRFMVDIGNLGRTMEFCLE
jgi:hypothetical protein